MQMRIQTMPSLLCQANLPLELAIKIKSRFIFVKVDLLNSAKHFRFTLHFLCFLYYIRQKSYRSQTDYFLSFRQFVVQFGTRMDLGCSGYQPALKFKLRSMFHFFATYPRSTPQSTVDSIYILYGPAL